MSLFLVVALLFCVAFLWSIDTFVRRISRTLDAMRGEAAKRHVGAAGWPHA